MFEKYIIVNESNILVGQTSSGIWYCKELPGKTTAEIEVLIGQMNTILNEYNNKNKDVLEFKKKKE